MLKINVFAMVGLFSLFFSPILGVLVFSTIFSNTNTPEHFLTPGLLALFMPLFAEQALILWDSH